jgi:tetratricopeptide (TPR) repeat protein
MPKPLGKKNRQDFREQIVEALQFEQAGRIEDAQLVYNAILKIDPRHSLALYRRAIYIAKRGNDIEALRLIRDAMKTNFMPQIAGDCGVILERLGRDDEAIEIYNRALVANPNDSAIQLNRANAFVKTQRYAQAAASFEKYLAQHPNDAKTHNLHGLALGNAGRHREAMEAFTRAIALEPDNADMHFHRALELLTLGDFEAGWEEYEWRFASDGVANSRSPHPQRHWDGVEPLAGKTILLYTEQGLGDSIMFGRYGLEFAARGANVYLGVLPPVKILFEEMPGVKAIAPGDQVAPFELQCPLLSAPYFLKTRIDSIPAKVPYIVPRPNWIEMWKPRLPQTGSKTVGVVWAGGLDFKGDKTRSIALKQFATLFDLPGINFVSLQRDLREGDADILSSHTNVLRIGEQVADFADTAAIISMFDLVISVDTSVAHLAGAMAKPVWILLPVNPDFRWMLERSDSPWYPTARLFRQPRFGDWDSVLADVKQALAQLG